MTTAKTIKLDTPIVRGEQTIKEVSIAKPNAGALRGTSLIAVIQMDVQALSLVLPRITTPALTQHDVMQMDPADLMAIGTEVSGFLVPKAERYPSE